MSFFNLRRSEPAVPNAPSATHPESADLVRRRAKHRFIGSAVLVLAGVLGFPLLFDTQPRPVPVDIPIEIPARNAAAPLKVAPTDAASKSPPAAKAVQAEKIDIDAGLGDKEEIFKPKQAESQPLRAQAAIKTEARPLLKTEVKAEPKAEAKAPLPEARLVARAAPAAAATEASKGALEEARLVVQVGAFSDAEKARDARLKLEKAGLKTYTQVTETKDGKRTRVRVGPFLTKAEAEKAAVRIKALDLPAAILSL
ncbi:MAG: SPOR domain-containing protein [Polaromonas sp.]|nr:SPOR domain-containing protein [Polaromonas sp.]